MNKKIVFFERISQEYVAFVNKYIQHDYVVYFFEIEKIIIDSPKIRDYIGREKLLNCSNIIFEYELYREAAFLAHRNVDAIFERYFSKSKSIETIIKLLDFPGIIDMYKKELLMCMESKYSIALRIKKILSDTKHKEAHFIPCDYFCIHLDETSPLRDSAVVVNCANFRITIKRYLHKLKFTAFLFYPIYLFSKKIRKISNNKSVKEYKVGIMIEKHPKSIFLMNYFSEVFYIDEKEFPQRDVLFIDENGLMNLDEYKKRNFSFTNQINDRETLSWSLFFKIMKNFFPAWLKALSVSLFEDSLISNTNRKIFSDYIIWNIFIDTYRIDNYLRRMLPDNISKMHILSENNVKTWFIYPDNSSVDFHINWNESIKNQTLFSFMYYDNAIIYGNIVERFFKKHRNFIKKYIKNGVTFSQIACEIRDKKINSIMSLLIEKKHLPKRIIGIFDTTYIDAGPLKVKDGISFGEDILKLLNDFPDIGIVFKTMKESKLTPYLIPVYDRLKNHERCVLIYRYDKEGISSPEVIAVSDLVISAAYTSPSAEALGARKKAIYYDIVGHDIGDKYYYNRIPNFVAHSYEELKKITNYWMNEVSDKEFGYFLNTYVKDEIDPYLDGKALTRMRRLLMKNEYVD